MMGETGQKPPCAYCGNPSPQSWSSINRALKGGKPIYCDRKCAGLGRRKGKTVEQKKEEKRLYDMKRREELADRIKAEKAAYHRRTYDPAKAAETRKDRMPYHVEYCRRPEYRAWKRDYDKHYLARKHYGEFGEAALILREIENAVGESGVDRFQRAASSGTLNKKQTRRRTYEQFQTS